MFIGATNRTNKPITIMSARTGCKCGQIIGVPIAIPARGTINIKFIASSDANYIDKSKNKQKILFFVNAGGTRTMTVELPLFEFLLHR